MIEAMSKEQSNKGGARSNSGSNRPVNSSGSKPNSGGSELGLFDLNPDQLRSRFEDWGEPAFRAKQVVEWAYGQNVDDYEQMSNLPKTLRSRLEAELPIYQSEIVDRRRATDGTEKLLLRWQDGATSECVLIPDRDRNTACISTQVGCPVGCVFCASGINGLDRQLTSGQIVEQAMRARQMCGNEVRLSNVVFMGLGEPLANYDATVKAVRTINADWGMGIGARKITVSTVGLPTQMKRLAKEGLQITLALSLHAPTEELRSRLIPWAKNVSIEELTDAAKNYFAETGREITIEYVMLAGVNDSPQQARNLVTLVRRMRANLNLIPFNPVDGLPYSRPTDQAIGMFLDVLRDRGVTVHVRRSRGRDVDAACGQLRRRQLKS